MIARVIPLTQTRAIKGLFDYLVAPQLGRLSVGALVRVPFAGRHLTAVVAELAERTELPLERLTTVRELLPTRLPADLVRLALWIAAEYCSTPARALQVLLPAGAARGLREPRALIAELTTAGRAERDAPASRLTPGQRAALDALLLGPAPAATLGTQLLRRLQARGLVSIAEQALAWRPAAYTVSDAGADAPALTAEQRVALDRVLAALAEGTDTPLLLHGVTGSGKTEVYLRAAQAALERGRGVIILVPEIALTPQALTRFGARFGETVAVLHSGLSDGRRRAQWQRLARGEARVCVGPRSAVFAPITKLGLVVVDEEHESSYKHESDPRYDARAIARKRALDHGAVLLLGSATPRPEAVLGTTRLRLRQRVDGRPLPHVEILDMRGLHHPLHPQTRLALADAKRQHGKAIVLLNRRGWSNFLACGSCGRVWMCPNCEVALVLHRASAGLACHHCGHHERVPTACPDCRSVSVARHGTGTERLEAELARTLGDDRFPVLRLDADSHGVDARARILERFHAARSGVLLGTQMIAKGHDFADVGLGVVVDADQTLRFPDFRAEERTFALITQLAGRAGRGGGRAAAARGGASAGRVLVQTRAPAARSIVLAAQHDSDTFVRGELRRRKALAYPPFTTLIRLVCAASDAELARAACGELRDALELAAASLLGPVSLFALRGRARSQLVVKTTARAAAITAVGAAVDALSRVRRYREVAFSVNVDPQ